VYLNPVAASQEPTRRHDLDWLRFIAILILLFFHTGMLFNAWGWHIKNNETSVTFQYWMVWSHYFRMPLLLFISGAGTYLAMGKRSVRQFAAERFRRLFIPLVFGMFVIVPPQIYFEHISEYTSYADFYPTVFNFVPYPEGSFSWHHLWFIMYLFLYSLLVIPYLRFLRSEASSPWKEKLALRMSNPLMMLLLPPTIMGISQFMLRPFFPDETHALIDDWAFFVLYGLFFVFGMTAYSSRILWERIGNCRNVLAMGMFASLVPFYTCYLHFRDLIELPMESETVELIFAVTSVYTGWCTVITIISFGQHYLNRPHRWLSMFNEGLYPFYILHQTVIIWIGYYVCKFPWSISAKYWSVALLTLLSCVAIYLLVIRPFRITRLLFGMKTSE
jgi:glucans biosynthesis protein C